MISLPLRLAVSAVRVWTRAYTWGLPAAVAEERRAEVDSDLWELQHDPEAAPAFAAAAQIAGRLIVGLADDLLWRAETAAIEHSHLPGRLVVLAGAILMLVVWWILPSPAGEGRGGGTRVADCASAARAPKSTAEFRLQVVECAGAFFTRRSGSITTGQE